MRIFFFFNGCLDSFMLSLSHSLMSCLWSLALIGCDKAQMVILSCHVIFVVLLVYIYNILTIGFGTLCFMHLVSGCNLNIFLANFFLTGFVTGYRVGSGRVTGQPIFVSDQKNRIQVRYFSDWVRKILTHIAMSNCRWHCFFVWLFISLLKVKNDRR